MMGPALFTAIDYLLQLPFFARFRGPPPYRQCLTDYYRRVRALHWIVLVVKPSCERRDCNDMPWSHHRFSGPAAASHALAPNPTLPSSPAPTMPVLLTFNHTTTLNQQVHPERLQEREVDIGRILRKYKGQEVRGLTPVCV